MTSLKGTRSSSTTSKKSPESDRQSRGRFVRNRLRPRNASASRGRRMFDANVYTVVGGGDVSSRRQERVADMIRDEVMDIIQREMSDPRLGFVSITRVELSPDMKYARMFVSVFGDDDEQARALVALNNAAGFIRRTLAPRLRMRVIPDVSFRLDRSMAHAENISRILRELEPELNAPIAASPQADDQEEDAR